MIRVLEVSKTFRIYATPADRLREKIFRRPYHHEYRVLSEISFDLRSGETLGIIGENGAGKSTLLKILSGVLLPDTGTIEVSGRVTGLLELGTGFNPELTGFQNIAMNGTFLGMSHEDIEAKRDVIIEFAELGEYINEPLKTYSSGMMMRLGFSIAIHADPECFLIDEALSVGDAYFQQKCMRKIQEFKEQGGSIIFVSHDMNAVKVLCDFGLLLDSGMIAAKGSPKEVVDYYNSIVIKKSSINDTDCTKVERINMGGEVRSELKSGSINLLNLRILSQDEKEVTFIKSEENFFIEFTFSTKIPLEQPHFGFMIRNRLGQVIFETNTYCMGLRLEEIRNPSQVTGRFFMNCPLSPGEYSVSLGVADKGYGIGQFEKNYYHVHDLLIIKVMAADKSIYYGGFFNMKPSFRLVHT